MSGAPLILTGTASVFIGVAVLAVAGLRADAHLAIQGCAAVVMGIGLVVLGRGAPL